jgi:hypothetical protein
MTVNMTMSLPDEVAALPTSTAAPAPYTGSHRVVVAARQSATALPLWATCAYAKAAMSLSARFASAALDRMASYLPVPSHPLRVPDIGNSQAQRCIMGASAIATHRPTTSE